MSSKHSQLTCVHRTLVYRLIAVGLTLSLFIGLAALLIERDRASQEAIDIAVGRLSLFSDIYGYLLEKPDKLEPEKINQAVIEFRSTRNQDKLGSFVFVGIYDAHQKVITEIFDEQIENSVEVKKKQQEMEIKMPVGGHNQYDIFSIAGLPYLEIALPLFNNSQKMVGVVNGVFAFAPQTIHAFRLRGLRAMFGAIVIVLLTTLILYPVILRLTGRITKFSVQLLDANLETLETLGSASAQRDSDTNAHNYRVSIYAACLGEKLNLPDQTMRTLIKGSFLHDVGNIGIPDEILLKPGKLDDNEFEIMKTHVEQGREIIKRSKWLHDALEVITSHHEKFEGKGYPLGTSGDDIPVTARIFAIADVFDALTSKRPYKNAWSFEEAMEILEEGSGSHFDPLVLEAFNRIAKPLYDKFGGKEEVFRKELAEIMTKYFHEGMDSLALSFLGITRPAKKEKNLKSYS